METINFTLTELLKIKKKYIKILENYWGECPENVVQKLKSFRASSKIIVKKIGELSGEIEDTSVRLSTAMNDIR